MKVLDVFDKNDEKSVLIISLAMIRNDLRNSMKYIMECIENGTVLDSGRQIYGFRMSIVHYREATKLICNAKEIMHEIIKLPGDDKIQHYEAKLKKIIDFAEPWESSMLRKFCKPMRDSSIHYAENKSAIIKALETTSKDHELIVTGANKEDHWSHLDYVFAGDFSTDIFIDPIQGEGIESIIEVSELLMEMVANMMQLIDYIIVKYIGLRSSKTSFN